MSDTYPDSEGWMWINEVHKKLGVFTAINTAPKHTSLLAGWTYVVRGEPRLWRVKLLEFVGDPSHPSTAARMDKRDRPQDTCAHCEREVTTHRKRVINSYALCLPCHHKAFFDCDRDVRASVGVKS